MINTKETMCRQKKLPKQIKIGYADFKVRHISKKTNKKDLGECDYTNHEISLFGNQADSELCDSLFHECLHGAIQIFNIPFKNVKEEEKYVRHFSNALITVFKDNPELLNYLQIQLNSK